MPTPQGQHWQRASTKCICIEAWGGLDHEEHANLLPTLHEQYNNNDPIEDNMGHLDEQENKSEDVDGSSKLDVIVV